MLGVAGCVEAALKTPAAGPFRFTDVTTEAGLGGFRQQCGDPEKPTILDSIGGGVALFDHDGDGDLDAFLTNGSSLAGARAGPPPRDALYRNQGDGRFVDVTDEVGVSDERWTSGVRVADFDGDGWRDLYLMNWGANGLWRNLEGRRFEDVTAAAGVGDERWSAGAAFLDFDLDGDLDLYVANYVFFRADDPPPRGQSYRGAQVYYGPRGMPGERDTFYVNGGDGRFADGTEALGLADSHGYGFGVVAFDYDEDGWVDVFVGNDSTPNYLWRNEGGRRFEERAYPAGVALSKEGMRQACMGVAVGDADGDGRFDLFVTNFSEDYHTLYRNDGGGFFSDVSVRAQLALPTLERLGWSTGFCDFDLDGDLDLFAVHGHVFPQVDRFDLGTSYHQRNQVFENDGAGRFTDVTELAGSGFAAAAAGRGGAFGDVDGDGDLDLLVGNLDGPPTLLRNDSERRGHWLVVELRTTRSNPEAVGAVVTVRAGGRERRRPVGDGSGFGSSHQAEVHFGLGPVRRVEEVLVCWPDGTSERWRDLETDRRITLVEGAPESELGQR